MSGRGVSNISPPNTDLTQLTKKKKKTQLENKQLGLHPKEAQLKPDVQDTLPHRRRSPLLPDYQKLITCQQWPGSYSPNFLVHCFFSSVTIRGLSHPESPADEQSCPVFTTGCVLAQSACKPLGGH